MGDVHAKPDPKAAEKKRLAEALRANLKRRKAAPGRAAALADTKPDETTVEVDRAGKD